MTVSNVVVGAVTSSVANVRAKITGSTARLAVATDSALTNPVFSPSAPPATPDGMVSLWITDLDPGTRYWYGVEEDGVLDTANQGQFRTHPPVGQSASFTFIVSSCAGENPDPADVVGDVLLDRVSNRPSFDTIRLRALAEDALFFPHLGDINYYNIGGTNPATTPASVDLYRRAYDDVFLQPRQARLYREIPLVDIFDDHDYGPNDSDSTAPGRLMVAQVWRERFPSYTLPDSLGACYQAFQVGRVLFVCTDSRFYRTPDTAPDDSSKTMLGSPQKTWLSGVLTTTDAKALVLLHQMQWTGSPVVGGDSWRGFTTERAELGQMFVDLGWANRMIIIGGDSHHISMDSGANNPDGGFPTYCFGAIDSGPNSGPGDGTGIADIAYISTKDGYGVVHVGDTGEQITLTTTAYIGDTVQGQDTLTMEAPTMPVLTQAARNGFPGEPAAVNKSAEVNQSLVTERTSFVYEGEAVVTSNTGDGLGSWFQSPGDVNEFDQPFTLSGTEVGRVAVPVRATGDGSDLLVSLCEDAGGVPGDAIVTCRIPRQWITAIAATDAIPTSRAPGEPGGAVTAAVNSLRVSGALLTSYPPPTVSDGFLNDPVSCITASGWMVFVGGVGSEAIVGADAQATVFTARINVDGTIGELIPQPPLPAGVFGARVVATEDNTLVVAGGGPTVPIVNYQATVYTAALDPATGQVSTWSTQQDLPTASGQLSMATYKNFVYVVGGQDNAFNSLQSLVFAQVTNGIISTWTQVDIAGVPLGAAVVGDQMALPVLYAGPLPLPPGTTALPGAVARIGPDGVPGTWRAAPSLSAPVVDDFAVCSTDSGFVQLGGIGLDSETVLLWQSLSVDVGGAGLSQAQASPVSVLSNTTGSMVPLGTGRWLMVVARLHSQLISTFETLSAVVNLVPVMSVPLPASGLVDGATYHLLLQPDGGDANNFLSVWAEQGAMPLDGQLRQEGSSEWLASNPIPITVYDRSAAGQLLHAYEADGARVVTVIPSGGGQVFAVADATEYGDGTQLPDVAAIYYDQAGRSPILAAPAQ